jgi:hypothetical protein
MARQPAGFGSSSGGLAPNRARQSGVEIHGQKLGETRVNQPNTPNKGSTTVPQVQPTSK